MAFPGWQRSVTIVPVSNTMVTSQSELASTISDVTNIQIRVWVCWRPGAHKWNITRFLLESSTRSIFVIIGVNTKGMVQITVS